MSGSIPPLPPNTSGSPDGTGSSASSPPVLREVARQVLRKARQQEFVVPREIREELHRNGLTADRWKDILHLAGPSLSCRHGRYYYVPAGASRMRMRVRHHQRRQQEVQRSVRGLLRRQGQEEAVHRERRAHKRYPFARPVLVLTADRKLSQFVTREISVSGIRLLSSVSLLGQELRLWFNFEADRQTYGFLVRILWSAIMGDGLWENGGVLLETLDEEPHPLQLADERNDER